MKTSDELAKEIWDEFDFEYDLYNDCMQSKKDPKLFMQKIERILSDWEEDIVYDCDMTKDLY